jgi:phosphatidylserine/phosphatidylglycerophosphate/cardiolipin synthase-like enzyme
MKLIQAALPALLLASCGSTSAPPPPPPSEEAREPRGALLELVETTPVETALGSPDLRETHEVWLEMITAAREELLLAHFYASNRAGSRLELIVQALEAAAGRGVHVRFLASESLAGTYPETLDRLDAVNGIEVLTAVYDDGGVLHSKAMVADRREVFLGSANFDWRALEHIQELGVRVHSEPLARAVGAAIDRDWARARGMAPLPLGPDGADLPARVATPGDQVALVWPVFSPSDMPAAQDLGELAALLDVLEHAERTVDVQLLTYRVAHRDGTPFPYLDDALRRAGERGVRVRMLVADWCKQPGTIESIQSLQLADGVDIRIASLPQWSRGFVPYSRVVHAKYLTVDGEHAWVGTSNWGGDYFHSGRNFGLMIEGGGIPDRLARYFEQGWDSPYAEVVDPSATYEPPRVAE